MTSTSRSLFAGNVLETELYKSYSLTNQGVPATPELQDVQHVYRRMHANSRTYLVNTGSGGLHVMKVAQYRKGDVTLFNEACGAVLGAFIGVKMGAWGPLSLDQTLLERYEHILRPNCDGAGIYFGGKLRSTSDSLLEFLPRSMATAPSSAEAFARVKIFDFWVALEGHRSYVAYENRKLRSVSIEFIRNASILSTQGASLQNNEGFGSRDMVGSLSKGVGLFTNGIIERIVNTQRDTLRELLEAVPPEWSDPQRIQTALDMLCTRRDLIGDMWNSSKVFAGQSN